MITTEIALKDILVDYDFNCRHQEIVPIDVFDLMEDIKVHGLLQPVLVRPLTNNKKCKYMLFAGFRRYASFKYLNLETIPAIIHEHVTEEDCIAINLSENIKRCELNILQEAWGINKFNMMGKSVDYIASRLDVSREWVRVRIMLLKLPHDIQKEAATGILNQKNIKDLVPIYEKNPQDAYKAVRELRDKKNKTKIKETKQQVIKAKKIRKFEQIFDIQDVLLDLFGSNLASRALAWGICEISTREFLNDVKAEAELHGIEWGIPIQFNGEEFMNDKVKS